MATVQKLNPDMESGAVHLVWTVLLLWAMNLWLLPAAVVVQYAIMLLIQRTQAALVAQMVPTAVPTPHRPVISRFTDYKKHPANLRGVFFIRIVQLAYSFFFIAA